MTTPLASDRPLDLVDRLRALYTPVVADVLDRLGYREQSLRPEIRPLSPGMKAAGYAHTARVVATAEVAPQNPYEGEMRAVDALRDGDILVASASEFSIWGELLSTAARYRGCRGVVLDGPTRDTPAIQEMGFPVFHRGIHPADSLGRVEVEAHDVPIDCGGVRIGPGDLILADDDGVVALPGAVAERVIVLAEEKVRGENLVRKALAEGMSVTEAFRRFGIL